MRDWGQTLTFPYVVSGAGRECAALSSAVTVANFRRPATGDRSPHSPLPRKAVDSRPTGSSRNRSGVISPSVPPAAR